MQISAQSVRVLDVLIFYHGLSRTTETLALAETEGIEPSTVLPDDCFLDSLPPLA